MNFFDIALKVFELDESRGLPGREGMPYRDSKGYWTIGIGHFIGNSLEDLKLPPEVIDELFSQDLARCIREASLVLGKDVFFSQTDARKIAILTLFFTMGATEITQNFGQTMDAIKRGDWDNVAERARGWKWAKDVDPRQRPGEGRDDRIIYMFKTGEFHPDYKVKV